MALILAIESSCDDTSAAVLENDCVRSNLIAGQKVHEMYGGVVPELASRAHQENIVPVVDSALKAAGIKSSDLDAIAFTNGPGLLGSLLVGVSFAKSMAWAAGCPMVAVNHLEAHVLAHFLQQPGERKEVPEFPYLCLLVSGGHTQILKVCSPFHFETLGTTIDDAAGETIDKAAKIMGLPYPGGPVIDRLAQTGNPNAFRLAKPRIPDLNYSFSGLKTSFLYLVRDRLAENPDFITENQADLCACIQQAVVDTLLDKLIKAAEKHHIKDIAIGGGVSANSLLRNRLESCGREHGWRTFLPPFSYTTDNAAMVGIAGYFKWQRQDFCPLDTVPYTRQGR